jgi:hypothetical protein
MICNAAEKVWGTFRVSSWSSTIQFLEHPSSRETDVNVQMETKMCIIVVGEQLIRTPRSNGLNL